MPTKIKRLQDAAPIYNPIEIDEFQNSRRVPVKKKSVYRIVFTFLQKYYDQGKINEAPFDKINELVKKKYPNSKFNPYHFAHYKHKFLVEAP